MVGACHRIVAHQRGCRRETLGRSGGTTTPGQTPAARKGAGRKVKLGESIRANR